MNALANLGTTSHSSPGINHRSAVHICPNIYVGRHHNNSISNMCTISGNGMRYYSNAQIFIIFLQTNLIMKFERTDFNCFHFLNREIKYHRFFDPFIYFPFVITDWFSHTDQSFIEFINDMPNGILCFLIF